MELKKYPKEYKKNALYYASSSMLAAKNIEEAFEILHSLFGTEERLQLGRRLQIAQLVFEGASVREIEKVLKTSRDTVLNVRKELEKDTKGYEICLLKHEDLQETYKEKKYVKVGGSLQVFKKTKKTDFKYSQLSR